MKERNEFTYMHYSHRRCNKAKRIIQSVFLCVAHTKNAHTLTQYSLWFFFRGVYVCRCAFYIDLYTTYEFLFVGFILFNFFFFIASCLGICRCCFLLQFLLALSSVAIFAKRFPNENVAFQTFCFNFSIVFFYLVSLVGKREK